MPMVRAMRLLNAIETGTTTGAQLQTLLTSDPGRLAELNVLLGMRGQARRVVASSTAMAAVVASSTAMAAVAASSTAATAIAASSTAMAAVFASPTALAAVVASPTAMAAVAANATAMAAVFASPTALAAVVASSTAMAAVAASSTAMAAVVASSTAMAAVAASSTAATAIAASSTAMAAVAASSTAATAIAANATANNTVLGSSFSVGAYLERLAINGGGAANVTLAAQATMTAVAASSSAMTTVWASNIAADAVLTSATARAAVYESNIALAQLQFTPIQVARQIGIGGRTVTMSTIASSHTFVANGTRVILLRRWYSGTETDMINWARGTSAAGPTNGVVAPVGGRVLYHTGGVAARGTVSGTYTDNGASPTVNDDTANFVAAANGLRRNTWHNGAATNVTYILV